MQRDENINEQRNQIKDLESEILRLKNAAAMGDQNASELQKLLAETQMKLEKALQDISGLESKIEANTKEYNSEYNRLNTEIERLNNILKATNGNMQEQITKLSDQIKKLQKEILDLKSNL